MRAVRPKHLRQVREEHFHKNLSAKQIQELYDLSAACAGGWGNKVLAGKQQLRINLVASAKVPAEFGNVDAFVSHLGLLLHICICRFLFEAEQALARCRVDAVSRSGICPSQSFR